MPSRWNNLNFMKPLPCQTKMSQNLSNSLLTRLCSYSAKRRGALTLYRFQCIPLTPKPPITARAAWGTCARDSFPPYLPCLAEFCLQISSVVRGSINQSESVFCAVILMTLEGSTKAPFYAFTRNDQIWKNGVHAADFQYFQVGFSVSFRPF